jgi:hypothetical protein
VQDGLVEVRRVDFVSNHLPPCGDGLAEQRAQVLDRYPLADDLGFFAVQLDRGEDQIPRPVQLVGLQQPRMSRFFAPSLQDFSQQHHFESDVGPDRQVFFLAPFDDQEVPLEEYPRQQAVK